MKTLEQLAREAGGAMLQGGEWALFGNGQLARFRAACRAEALEEAAQRCDKVAEACAASCAYGLRDDDGPLAKECAAAIREMK